MMKVLEALGSKTLLLTIGGICTVLTSPGLTPMQRMEGIVALISQYCIAQKFHDGMAAHGSDKTDAEIEAAKEPLKP